MCLQGVSWDLSEEMALANASADADAVTYIQVERTTSVLQVLTAQIPTLIPEYVIVSHTWICLSQCLLNSKIFLIVPDYLRTAEVLAPMGCRFFHMISFSAKSEGCVLLWQQESNRMP